jgi:hypothetical protein
MNRPKAVVHLRTTGGFMIAEERREILSRIAAGRSQEAEFLTLHGITFEGHEMTVSVRIDEVATVQELGEERWQFELDSFMRSAAAKDADTEMKASWAKFGEQATREMGSEGD